LSVVFLVMTKRDIHRAAAALRRGELVAFPTETVYGLGADATSGAAVAKIFAAKGRPSTNPLIVHVADTAAARRWTTGWTDQAQALADALWPGAITLVLPRSPAIVDAVTAGRATVGLRVPAHPLALQLLAAFDGPVAAPSANRSNHISPTTAAHVRQELGDRVHLVLDGGPCAVGIESTVLDLSSGAPAILRPGGVSAERIEAILGRPVRQASETTDAGVAAASPGQQAIHYAPDTPAYHFAPPAKPPANPRGGYLLLHSAVPAQKGLVIRLPDDAERFAQALYGALRELDQRRLSAIYIELPPPEPLWTAVRDRLLRASRPMTALAHD
jgi:L-threonylcarbamoyladenylate synthase